jgi:hypothetical protein
VIFYVTKKRPNKFGHHIMEIIHDLK